MTRMGLMGLVLPLWLLAGAQAKADCNQPTADAALQVPVPGHPFSAIPTADGCAIFVSLPAAKESHLIVLKRDNGTVSPLRDVSAQGTLTGMALSPDGRFLAAANSVGVTLFDTAKLISGADKPALGYLNDKGHASSVYTAFSPDQRLLFISDEGNQSITVYDFQGILAGKGTQAIGAIRTGDAPVGLAFSPDGKLLYSTSEAAYPGTDCSEGGGRGHGPGALMVIDVAKAATAPADAVLARTVAGCSPVRVALSADGAKAYVSARAQNMLLVFDTAKLVAGGEALVAKVPVGIAPVGVAVGKGKIFVTNSDRFGGSTNQSVSVVSEAELTAPQGSIPAGGFPRELKLTADGKTLLVTNFTTGTVELVDLARLSAK